jgi:hypothetical protein
MLYLLLKLRDYLNRMHPPEKWTFCNIGDDYWYECKNCGVGKKPFTGRSMESLETINHTNCVAAIEDCLEAYEK